VSDNYFAILLVAISRLVAFITNTLLIYESIAINPKHSHEFFNKVKGVVLGTILIQNNKILDPN
jgi:hypothetical protein